jgi:hypothetical protein
MLLIALQYYGKCKVKIKFEIKNSVLEIINPTVSSIELSKRKRND